MAGKKCSQVEMFFLPGTAQTNGGGSLCMVTYSLDSCSSEGKRWLSEENGRRTRLLAALVAIEDQRTGLFPDHCPPKNGSEFWRTLIVHNCSKR